MTEVVNTLPGAIVVPFGALNSGEFFRLGTVPDLLLKLTVSAKRKWYEDREGVRTLVYTGEHNLVPVVYNLDKNFSQIPTPNSSELVIPVQVVVKTTSLGWSTDDKRLSNLEYLSRNFDLEEFVDNDGVLCLPEVDSKRN